ncbi:MAG TPA: SWIM zinc finger family protein, partial [Humisphaera sp.]
MSLLQEYARDFSSDIRKRGEAYQRDRAVQITDSGPGYVEAEVTGTDAYRVMVEHDPDEGAKYDCDCPYFADHGPCKHCWATVVEAFEQGALPGGQQAAAGDGEAAARPEPRVVPVEAEGMDEDAAADADETAEDAEPVRSPAGGFVPGQRQPTVDELRRMNPQQLVEAMRYKAPPRMFEDEDRRRNQPRNEDAWRNQLKRLSDAMAARPAIAPKPLAWPKGRRVVYVVDQRQTLENGLTLVPMQETPKRDGGYERARLLRISQYQVGQLPDPVDRHIIQLLTGTGRSGFGYYYDMPLAESFDVDESATEDVLRQVCATGRCRLAPEGNDGPLIPVRWDDGPAWEFCLHLRPSPGGRYL